MLNKYLLPKVYYGYSVSAKLNMLVVVILDGRNGVEVLTDQVTQYAVSRTVQDTNAAHTNECGVIDKVHHRLDGLVAAHATHVDIGLERQLAIEDVVMSLLAHVCSGTDILSLDRLGGLQAVGLDYGRNLTECHSYVILVYLDHFAHLSLTVQTYAVTDLERGTVLGNRYVKRLGWGRGIGLFLVAVTQAV